MKTAVIKCIPFLLILFGCGGYGISSAGIYEKKYRELMYLKQIFANLSIALERGHLTFGECCLEVSKGCREPYRAYLMYMYEELEQRREYGLAKIWDEGIGRLGSALQIKELDTLRQVACLGNADFAGQPIATLTEVNVALEELIHNVRKDKKEKGRLAICLGFSVGCMLCIIFL